MSDEKAEPITAFIGNTRFTIEDTEQILVLKITRTNERITEFFIPRELVLEYAWAHAMKVFSPMIWKLWNAK